MVKIELTKKQKELLEPFFQQVREGNETGKAVAIGAQIWPDGMVVRVFDTEAAKSLSASLGGNFNRVHTSASDRIDSSNP